MPGTLATFSAGELLRSLTSGVDQEHAHGTCWQRRVCCAGILDGAVAFLLKEVVDVLFGPSRWRNSTDRRVGR